MLLLKEAMVSKHKANSMTNTKYQQIWKLLRSTPEGSGDQLLQQMVLGSHLILGSRRAVSTLLMFLEVPVLLRCPD